MELNKSPAITAGFAIGSLMLLPVKEQDKRPFQSIGSTPQKQDAPGFEALQDNYDKFIADIDLMSLMQFCT
jgi:hypothetical protein